MAGYPSRLILQCLRETDLEHYALISRIRPDGSNYEVFAKGVRNTEGFDWHLLTKALWFTDISRVDGRQFTTR
ncbi:MAG: hypothetical protein P0107_04710 [Nitrosomonas sp.]|nr:hypothetical protein [Nitrosomonas sp.]